MILRAKIRGGGHGQKPENWHFPFFGVPAATVGRLGTAMGTGHTSADRQCADTIETGVGADGPARIHTDTESWAFDMRKTRTGLLT